jgi:sugar phosphate isomerase/epimerase
MNIKRRNVLRSLALSPALLYVPNLLARKDRPTPPATRVQYSVNAYSFNKLLRSGEMDFFDMMEFAADIGLNAVDLTAYYFSAYPDLPKNKEVFVLKKRALELGLNISWTGVRNDFVTADAAAREADREMIRKWLSISSTLGASIMRIFTGKNPPEGFSRTQVTAWMVEEFKKCAELGEDKGVVVALQNHNEFLFTAEEVIDVLEKVDSEWFGLILDTSSLRTTADPYTEAAKLAPYADYWFIKEHAYHNQKKKPVDMAKMAALIKKHNYRGYISFESLSDGDPKEIVASMLEEFRRVYEGG